MKVSAISVLVILLGSLLCPQPSRAASVTLTPVRGVGRLHGINRGNQAAGYTLGGDEPDAFIYEAGNLTRITIRNAAGVQVFGIENNGRAVGKYYEYDPVTKAAIKTHGLLYFHGDVTNIDFPQASVTVCFGINDLQRIVGYFKMGEAPSHAFFFDKQEYIRLPEVQGATSSYATGINNPGDIVGYYTDASGRNHGFLYDRQGNLSTIDVNIPGVTVVETQCWGINSLGVIVGTYIDGDGNTHGFVDVAGVFLSVDAPGTPPGIGTLVQGINDNGQLTAFGATAWLGNLVQ
jgi:probable HAF family extracellular repeat protein